jgi:hypothetical protein
MSVSDDIRALIGEFYLPGTTLGLRLEKIVTEVESLERAASPVSDPLETECGGRPCVAEDGQEP